MDYIKKLENPYNFERYLIEADEEGESCLFVSEMKYESTEAYRKYAKLFKEIWHHKRQVGREIENVKNGFKLKFLTISELRDLPVLSLIKDDFVLTDGAIIGTKVIYYRTFGVATGKEKMKPNVMYVVKKKPVVVDAVEALSEVVVETKEGPRTAYPGDYILTGVLGEHWPIEREKFMKTYTVIEANEGGLVAQSISGNRYAIKVDGMLQFKIRNEVFTAQAGDIIIRYGDGDYAPCVPEAFNETYNVVGEANLDQMIDNAELYDLLSGEKYGL